MMPVLQANIALLDRKIKRVERTKLRLEAEKLGLEAEGDRQIALTIGFAVTAWAGMELTLDGVIYALFRLEGAREIQPEYPVSLKAKLAFWRKANLRLPQCAAGSVEAVRAIEEIQRLKAARHDFVHGFAVSKAPAGAKIIMRNRYHKEGFVSEETEYTFEDIAKVVEDTVTLTARIKGYFDGISAAVIAQIEDSNNEVLVSEGVQLTPFPSGKGSNATGD